MQQDVDLADTLLQCSTDCIKILDDQAKILFFNSNGLAAMEIESLASVAGIYWPLLWPKDAQPVLEQSLAEVRSKGIAHFQAPCPTAKGTPKWWDVTMAVIPGGERRRFVVISKDITLQRELENEDRKSLERFTSAFRSSGDVLWDIDLLTDKVWWGEGMNSVFGYGKDQVGATTKWCHEHIHPDDRQRIVDSMAAAVEGDDVLWEGEFRYRKANGDYLEVYDRGLIVRDTDGSAQRFIGTMKDVTARNAVSAQEKLMSAELAHRINNTLAVVSGIFHQSMRSSADLKELSEVFGSRLQAMSTANSVLMRGGSDGADLKDLAATQMRPYLSKGRLTLDGSSIALPLNVAQALALALNELATNAIKYGALSTMEGTVALSWQIDVVDGTNQLTLQWIERGGPPILEAPKRVGLGSRLISSGIPGAKVLKNFATEGFRCEINLLLPATSER